MWESSESVESSGSSESITETNQRDEGTCNYHASAKVIIQNMFESFKKFDIDKRNYKDAHCNDFLDKEIYKDGERANRFQSRFCQR